MLLVPRGRRKPLPPLRERRGDVPLLITRALEQARDRSASGPPPACSPLAMRLLRVYDWPGNVRELFSVLERAAIEAALAATGGALTKAAGLLGMGRTTLWRKMKVYGIASRADENA